MYEGDISSSLDSVARAYTGSPKKDTIQLFHNLLRAQLGNSPRLERLGAPNEWVDLIFKQSDVFYGHDELMWGSFVACVYYDPQDSQLSCILIDKIGVSCFSPIDVTVRSQYYPAIENLTAAHKNSESRQCIAVTFLQRFAQLSEKDVHRLHPETFKFDYDPTHAGDLASACTQIEGEDRVMSIGRKLLSLGVFQNRLVGSTLLDVVYEYKEAFSESNNKLVFYLGQQLEQLFNPLTEYSPEQTEYTYKAPDGEVSTEEDDALVKAISRELLDLQTNFTLNLVEFLQRFVIILRVWVLNGEIEGLSTVKLNRLFPPTIDEVTRINCIFLDSLKSATPYGSLEILKACSVTIPYFYKAYTRHEAATKHFNKNIKLFLKTFSDQIPLPHVFSEMKIDSLIKGPQEKLMKIKLILDRLYTTKEWKPENQEEAKKCYDNVIEVIDSFGRLEGPLSSYSSRVFTPSGKIFTELAKDWPAELQYRWLKRRVVGVFDLVDPNDITSEKLLVIFSDYLVFLDVLEDRHDYGPKHFNKPSISDILMNSLVNEVPLPSRIPQLKVNSYCYIDEVIVTLFDKDCIRFDALKSVNPFAITLKVNRKSFSAFVVADLVTKAKILEKDTAFHLFKASHDDITIYSTAHEKGAYNNETLKSQFVLFLNTQPTQSVIIKHRLHVAMFARIVPGDFGTEQVQLDILTSDGTSRSTQITLEELVPVILRQLSFEIPVCFSSIYSPSLPLLLAANESIIKGLRSYSVDNSKSRSVAKNLRKQNPATVSSSVTNGPSQHRPTKTYTTITTFRSNISDTKTVGNRKSEDRYDFEEPEHLQKSQTKSHKSREKKDTGKQPVSRLSICQESQSSSKTGERPQKRRSLGNIFKSIFSSKKKATNSTAEDKTKDRTGEKMSKQSQKFFPSSNNSKSESVKGSSLLQNKNPKKASDRGVSSTEEVRNEFSASAVHPNTRQKVIEEEKPTSFEPEQSNMDGRRASEERLSTISDFPEPTDGTSVKNNGNCTADRKSESIELVDEKIDQPKEFNSFESQEGAVPSASKSSEKNIGTSLNQDYEHDKLMASQASHSDFSQQNRKQNVIAEEGHRRKPSRESQVFNDDLFGDVITKDRSRSTTNEAGEVKSNKGSFNIQNNSQASTGTGFSNANNPENLHQREKHSDAITIESIQDKFSQKKPINPKVRNLKASKIDFERSSSFMELFQGMRLVLDDSDAKYNWKRLPSEYSLRDTLPVNLSKEPTQQPQTRHAFKPITFSDENMPSRPRPESSRCRPSQEKLGPANSRYSDAMKLEQFGGMNQNDVEGKRRTVTQRERQIRINRDAATQGQRADFINRAMACELSIPELEYEDKKPQLTKDTDNRVYIASENPALFTAGTANILQKERTEDERDMTNELFEKALSLQPEFGQRLSPERSPKNKIPKFKVVDRSPTRIIQRISPDRATSPYTAPSEISIASDLNERANKRLFELKFSSKDDVNDGESPVAKGHPEKSLPDIITQSVEYASETSTPSVRGNCSSNTTPEDFFPVKATPRGDNGLLEDLDFSSFNVTFDNFNSDRDISRRSILCGPSATTRDREPLSTTIKENPRPEEPVVYHLPESDEGNVKKVQSNGCADMKRAHKDDDPVWISPSKLDYYDFDNFNRPPSLMNTRGMVRSGTSQSIHNLLTEDPTSTKELSYTYLASFINDDDRDDQPFNADDKPVRLTFKA